MAASPSAPTALGAEMLSQSLRPFLLKTIGLMRRLSEAPGASRNQTKLRRGDMILCVCVSSEQCKRMGGQRFK